ncbi:MAG TPA: hypothetical protein VGN57_19805 [Pirellulaceae bacterium]|jgi:hypothetical protein|nr:hypothetical protein [Pirellulaceae bacterium]
MDTARRLRRLLREMTTLERVVFTTASVCYFVLGLVAAPLFFGHVLEQFSQVADIHPFVKEIGAGIPFDNPLFIAPVAFLAAGMAALQMAAIVRLAAFLPSIGERIDALYRSIGLPAFGKWPSVGLFAFLKLGVLTSPSQALGCVAGMALAWLGMYETPPGFYALTAVLASQAFGAGIGGMAVMVYMREYEHSLPRLIAELRRILGPQTG